MLNGKVKCNKQVTVKLFIKLWLFKTHFDSQNARMYYIICM